MKLLIYESRNFLLQEQQMRTGKERVSPPAGKADNLFTGQSFALIFGVSRLQTG